MRRRRLITGTGDGAAGMVPQPWAWLLGVPAAEKTKQSDGEDRRGRVLEAGLSPLRIRTHVRHVRCCLLDTVDKPRSSTHFSLVGDSRDLGAAGTVAVGLGCAPSTAARAPRSTAPRYRADSRPRSLAGTGAPPMFMTSCTRGSVGAGCCARLGRTAVGERPEPRAAGGGCVWAWRARGRGLCVVSSRL